MHEDNAAKNGRGSPGRSGVSSDTPAGHVPCRPTTGRAVGCGPVSESRSPGERIDVCVVGSANLDIVVPVPRLPVAGETVLGGDHARIPGGKGANQAVAAARLGRSVAFVGCVGTDPAGLELLAALRDDGVDLTLVRVIDDAPSGIALIAVGPTGDNLIVVSPGANGRVAEQDVERALPLLERATVTLLQLEIPIETVTEAAEAAAGVVVLNPAPAQALTSRLLESVDVLVPNETELALLAGAEIAADFGEVVDQARLLPTARTVVTLGAQGALVVDEASVHHQPAPEVSAVDTTAAGDAFCGALADVLAEGGSLQDAVAWGVMVGAATTLRPGAQPSLPTAGEVADLLGLP